MNKFFNVLRITALFCLFSVNILADDIEEKPNEQISPELPINIKEQIKEIKDERSKEEQVKDDKVIFRFGHGKNTVGFSLRNRTEAFYGKSIQLFSPSSLDQVVYAQYTWDFKIDSSIGNSIKSMAVLRHKGRWGNPNTIARTTEDTIKLADAVAGKHRHFLGKQIIWLREGWIDISLNDAFCLNAENRHYLTLGSFSFRLGRGIALGDAYAVSPGLLGFYSNNVIDQYAPAILAHGDIRKNKVTYDIYLALLENLSDSFDNVNEEIYSMQIKRGRTHPQRGFGKLNYVIASRLMFTILNKNDDGRQLTFEPYVLFNTNSEQDVEFPSDAKGKLVTFGMAMEYEGPCWDFGFDFAQNFGKQRVRAWDRNQINIKRGADTAALTLVYSKVDSKDPSIEKNPPKALVTDANKKVVNKAPQNPVFNGKEIDNSGLFNDPDRFRKCYDNALTGFMFVADAGYRFSKEFKISATVAIASGDEDPNVDLDDPLDSEVDGDYTGFIGLQESYSGKRVPSAFVLGMTPTPRPLSVPSVNVFEEDRFAQNITGFSNLVYCGFGLDWSPCRWDKQFSIRPNILAYWLEHAVKAFSLKQQRTIDRFASKFLGIELNIFSEVKLLTNLKAFLVAGVFFPGKFYDDVKGKPLNPAQQRQLKELNDTGFNKAHFPFLNNHTAFMMNWGFEYVF